jgi:hypothetical protein
MKHGYEESVARLSRELGALTDLSDLCARTGSTQEPGAITLTFINRGYRIRWPEVAFSFTDSDAEVSLKDRVLILHYLATAKGTPVSGEVITYRDVPDGLGYYDVFQKRAIRPWLSRFAVQPEGFIKAGAALGAKTGEFGDASIRVMAFERVPVTLVLWRGDDEFPAEGGTLFDASVVDYLSAYAITELCEVIAWSLVHGAGR